VPVEVECVAQRPTQALLERAETARLLVVGGRGHGVTRPGQLGTVSRAVLYDAACSVAVLRGHVASDRS
jgi:nucleotide-binding universal stress UspA family protein